MVSLTPTYLSSSHPDPILFCLSLENIEVYNSTTQNNKTKDPRDIWENAQGSLEDVPISKQGSPKGQILDWKPVDGALEIPIRSRQHSGNRGRTTNPGPAWVTL